MSTHHKLYRRVLLMIGVAPLLAISVTGSGLAIVGAGLEVVLMTEFFGSTKLLPLARGLAVLATV